MMIGYAVHPCPERSFAGPIRFLALLRRARCHAIGRRQLNGRYRGAQDRSANTFKYGAARTCVVSCQAEGREGSPRRKPQAGLLSPGDSINTVDRTEGVPWRWERSDNALQAYTIFFGLLALGQIPALKTVKFAELPYFVGLACLTIYIGAHRGLNNKMRQQISFRQGALAPLAASAALFSGFLLIKYLPWINLQTVCSAYFWCIGSAAVIGALGPPLRQAAGPLGVTSIGISIPDGVLLDEEGNSINRTEIAPSDLLAVLVGLAAASLDFAAGHQNYTFNNLLACLICCDILQLIGLRSFRTAAVLLFGLLAYDVFWVFGSPKVIGENVMLTVATSNILSGPTRLLFPRGAGSIGEAASFPFSLLGLGDIAVPGLLACLALRFDASRLPNMRKSAIAAAAPAIEKPMSTSEPGRTAREMAHAAEELASAAYDDAADRKLSRERPHEATEEVLQQRPFFLTTMVAYVAGLGIAFGVNAVTHLGQPALLWICPTCLGAVVLAATTRQQLGELLAYQDHISEIPLLKALKQEAEK